MNSPQLIKKQQEIAHLIEKGKLKEAIKPLIQVCNQQPDNTTHWLKLASLYGQLNEFRMVIKVCRKIEPALQDNPNVYYLLGSAYASLSMTDKAHECYQHALKLLNNLGNALFLDNKLEEAAVAFQRVVAIAPDYADAHNNLGNIYKALNDNELAIKYYEQAVKLNPRLYKALLNLAHIFVERIGHPEIAESYFRKAQAIEPDNIEAISGVINMLHFQGKQDEALSMIEQVPKKFKPGALAAKADIYERTGNFDGAYEIAREMLDKKTAHPLIVDVLMRICHKYDCCDEALAVGEELVSNQDIPATYLQNTHFELGRLYDKLDRYDDAFKHYKAGNNIINIPFHAEKFKKLIDNHIYAYRRERCDSLSEPTVDTSLPVFIVGMPRSGTTLTEQILSSHPDVEGGGELNDINDIAAGLATTLKSDKPYLACISDLDTPTMNKLATSYLENLRSFSKTTRFVTDKMPQNFINIGLISLLFPKAKIIHCTRDPRDTCLSIYFQNFGWIHPYGNRLEWLGFYYQQYVRLMDHWKNEFGINMHTVDYADVVSNQEITTRKLLEYCDLPWDDACMNFHLSRRVVSTASYNQVRRKIYKKSQGRWRNYEKHITPLIDALGDLIGAD